MYTGQQRWHLTLPGSNHEQSGGCQEGAIDTTKGGAGYKQGHDPGHLAIQPDHDDVRDNVDHYHYDEVPVREGDSHCL